ncbi:uncharacterized protein LOC112142037 [Oryzias melastigma]|uniref:uncharacterized protein LOC112142037 n=1 Tax=Oryzias melastigma TaxID=30732 RepID=UPI000CF82C13|nr:uncharacterized protein LOC112142037 [Oryzias melastigma]
MVLFRPNQQKLKTEGCFKGKPGDQQPVTVLCDSGGSQSYILSGILPLNDQPDCGANTAVRDQKGEGKMPRFISRSISTHFGWNILQVFLLSEVSATIYMTKGATVVLSPGPVTHPLHYVKWTHDGNIAADWLGYKTTCFQQFEGRCHINTENGNLTLNNLTVRDSGTYRVKIDGVVTDVTKLKVISSVLKPRISSECNSINCTLTCEEDITEDMEPVWFFWTIDGVQRPGTKELIITEETGRDFSCTLKNNVSSEDSSDMKNPLETGSPTLIIIISITAAVLLVLLVAYCSKHRESAELPPKEKSLTERNQNGLLKESRGKWWT